MDMELVPENVRLLVNSRRLLDVVSLATDLGLFPMIRRETTLPTLSAMMGIDEPFVKYLMDVLCSFGYVEAVPASNGTIAYRSTPVSVQYLDSGSPLFIGKEILESCETGALVGGYARNGPVTPSIDKSYWLESRIRSIAGVALLGGLQSTMAAVDLSGRQRLLDIGGGHGLYSIFFTKKYPGLKATIVELPDVAAVARDYVRRCDAEGSVNIVEADYHDFRPECLYDVVFISNVAASAKELGILLDIASGCLKREGMLVLRNYVSDAPADPWSSVTMLERYSRRGIKGLTTGELAGAMAASGLSSITTLAYHDCTVLLSGVKI
jgi:Predicted O-methyltransferase